MMRSVATSSAAAASTTSTNTQAAAGTDEGEKKTINPELWQACAGPLVNLPAAGTHVVYFPQGHSEQVAASMKKDVDAQIPNYPNLPSKLLCLLHNVTLHADPDTDEVYAQMTLQPVPSFDKEALLRSDLSLKVNKPQPDFFCKTLTASDTSTHGGFSVPRRAAEKIFPPLDYTMQPPAQELVAKDLHDTVWTFRHIYRGQPKRHLLTTGWSLFVSGKRLFAGDSVLFIRDDRQQLLLGLRRANRQPTNLSSSVLSTDSMHIGILAAAAHAAANNSPFTIFYNPRTSPTEFVIPLAKYYRALYGQQISLGMRFRMLFETEESGTRRYMGTITGISDLDPVRWKNSQWRNLQVGWDESTAGDKRNRVSAWEIEPVTAPFFICPPPFLGAKRPRQPGMPDDYSSDLDNLLKRTMPWLGADMYMKDPQALNGMNLVQWMNMQQISSFPNNILQPNNYHHSFPGSSLPNLPSPADMSRQMTFSAPQATHQNNLQQFNMQRQVDQQQKQSVPLNNSGTVTQPHDVSVHLPPNLINQHSTSSQVQSQIAQPSLSMQNHGISHNPSSSSSPIQNNQLQRSISGQIPMQQQPVFDQNQLQSLMTSSQLAQLANQQGQVSGNQLQRQLLQNLHQHQQQNLHQHQQQQPLLCQQTLFQQSSQPAPLQDQQTPILDVSHSFSRSMTPASQVLEIPQAQTQPQATSLTPLQMNRSIPFSQQPQIPKPQPQQQKQPCIDNAAKGQKAFSSNMLTRHVPASGSGNFSGATVALGQSVVTDDIPSCSTSPSTNNCSTIQTTVNGIPQCNMVEGMIARSSSLPFFSEGLETMPIHGNTVKDFHLKSDMKSSINVSKANQSQDFLMQQAFQNIPPVQIDYLDTSSATSASLSQGDAHLNQNNSSFNSQSILLRDPSLDAEVPAQAQNCAPSLDNIDAQNGSSLLSESMLKKSMVGSVNDFTNLESGGLLGNFDNCKDAQQELSSSMVTQSFGVPDMAFNSIDSTMSDSSFLNRNTWGPPPQYQRMRSYTKVYKRGAVGRSIDVTRYSGYDELKQDLARRFGIEGQLEDRGRVGWKLVYVDHEDDVLLVGDDPWEEFVRCVRHIKILSPQEVQQMSLDGDYGNPSLPNQACSSSDNV